MDKYEQIDFGELELDKLIDYIIDKHHVYCKQMLPMIASHLLTVTDTEKINPDFKSISNYFFEFVDILEDHLRKEEQIFYPFLIKVLGIKGKNMMNLLSQLPLIENPIHMLQAEHEKLISILSRMRNNTHNYFAPEKSSATLNLCYNELCEFEKEYLKHIQLEENYLFPKILELEQRKKN